MRIEPPAVKPMPKIRKLYDLIKDLLQENVTYRNSDKRLQWAIFVREGLVIDGRISEDGFMRAMSTETIRRTRQKIQENHPELGPTAAVRSLRKDMQRQKGTHVYRTKVPVSDNLTGKTIEIEVERKGAQV